MITSGVGALLGFVFWIVVSRHFPASQVGIAAVLISTMGLLSLLSSLGFHVGLVRFLPGENDKSGMINSIFTITAILCLIAAVIFIAGLPVWSPALVFLQGDTWLWLCFILGIAVTNLFMMQKYVFVATRSTEYDLLQGIVWNVLKVALAFVLVALGTLGILLSWSAAMFLALVVGNVLILKIQPGYRPFPVIRKALINKAVKFSSGSYVAEIAAMGAHYLLPLLIVNILGAEAHAYFYIAFKIAQTVFMLPIAVVLSLFTEGSHDPEKLRENFLKATKLMTMILIPVVILIALFGSKVLWLFGEIYSHESLHLLWILLASTIPMVINELYVTVKRVELKVRSTVYIYSLITILTLGACYVLMNWIGLAGVAWGWLAGQVIGASITGWALVKMLRQRGTAPIKW